MARHKPNVVWLTAIDSYPYGQVKTIDFRHIAIGLCVKRGGEIISLVFPRYIARKIAKRINQCLDDTK